MSKPAILLTAVLLAGSLLMVPAPAEASFVSDDSPASVRVVVDADALGSDAEAFFEEQAHASVSAALDQAGYRVTDQVDADVTVRVRMSFYNADDLDYEVDVDISAGAALVRLETAACPQCVDADLLERIDALGGDVASGVARALSQAEPREVQRAEPDDERPAAIGPVGIAGGVVAGVGLGVTIAGAVELSRGKVFDDPTRIPGQRTYVEHRTLGGVMLGVGLVAVAAGTTMLIVDLVERTKARKRGRPQAGTTLPLISPGLLGVGYTQQF